MSGIRQKLYSGYRYKRWRDKVMLKGGNKCCLCGNTENLTADHIVPAVANDLLFYDVDNGRILCETCRVKDLLDGWQKGMYKHKQPKIVKTALELYRNKFSEVTNG